VSTLPLRTARRKRPEVRRRGAPIAPHFPEKPPARRGAPRGARRARPHSPPEEPMQKQNRTVVVGVFADQARARQAVDELRRDNFREDQIGVVGRHAEEKAYSADRSTGSHVAEGAGIGVAAGAGVGALWALGIIAGVLPGVGPAVAGGILGSLLASAA